MSALYFLSSDSAYYSVYDDIKKFNLLAKNKELEKGKINKIIPNPTKKQLMKYAYDDSTAFLSWRHPDQDDLDFFVVKNLPFVDNLSDEGKKSLLTTQELRFGVTETESLAKKLNLEVIETTNTYDSLAGAEEMKEFFSKTLISYRKKKVKKITVFLLGIPGAGKTYVAECVAGQYNRRLIKLDLSKLMGMPNPVQRLNYFFQWVEKLAKEGIYIVALLDEIAQMLRGDNYLQNQFKGQLLTILEDLNTPRGYYVGESIFIATENKIRDIMNTTPQFMARWMEAFFINFPKKEDAIEMIKMYMKKYEVKLNDVDGIDEDARRLYTLIDKYWRGSNIQISVDEARFIYAPREIEKYISKLSIFSEGESEITNEMIRKTCKLTPAQQNMLREGIIEMINDAGMGFIQI